MHPTIDEQLHGAQRLLDLVEADSELSVASRESLTNVRRLLEQVGRSWSRLLAFRSEDNASLVALLARTAPLVGPELRDAVDGALRTAPLSGSDLDVAVVSARNDELRGMLARVIAELPTTPEGHAARAEIAVYLRRRVDADPS